LFHADDQGFEGRFNFGHGCRPMKDRCAHCRWRNSVSPIYR
jgi:hypothetical protein